MHPSTGEAKAVIGSGRLVEPATHSWAVEPVKFECAYGSHSITFTIENLAVYPQTFEVQGKECTIAAGNEQTFAFKVALKPSTEFPVFIPILNKGSLDADAWSIQTGIQLKIERKGGDIK